MPEETPEVIKSAREYMAEARELVMSLNEQLEESQLALRAVVAAAGGMVKVPINIAEDPPQFIDVYQDEADQSFFFRTFREDPTVKENTDAV